MRVRDWGLKTVNELIKSIESNDLWPWDTTDDKMAAEIF
jgi:hypothetical protein